VRQSLADAKTASDVGLAAATEAKRITGRDIPFDYHGVEPQLAREYSEGVLRGLERYPSAPLGAVRTTEFPPDPEGETTWAHTLRPEAEGNSSGKYEIEFNGANGVAGQVDEMLHMKQARGAYAFGDVQGLALHEFGHVLHEHAGTSDAAKRVANAYAEKNVPAPVAAPGKRRFGVGPHAPGELTAEQVQEHKENKRVFLLREISFYSQDSPHELAAEAFADVMTNGAHASPLSHQITDLLGAS